MDLAEWAKLVQKPILPGISSAWLHSGPIMRKPRGSAEGERQHLVSEAYREYFMRTPRALPFPTVDGLERWLAAAATGRPEPQHPTGGRVGHEARQATLGFCSLVPGLLADSPYMQEQLQLQAQSKLKKQKKLQQQQQRNQQQSASTRHGSNNNGDYTGNGINNNATITTSMSAATNNAAHHNGVIDSGGYSASTRAGRSYLTPTSRVPLTPPSSRREADRGNTRGVQLSSSLNSLLAISDSVLRASQTLNPTAAATSLSGPGRSILGSKRKRRGAVQSDDDDGDENGEEGEDDDDGNDSDLGPPAAKRSLSGSAFSDRARELGDSLERARRQLQEAEHDNLPSSRAAASTSPRALADLVRRAERRRRNEMRRVLEEEQRDFLAHELPRMQAYEELKVKLAGEVRQTLEEELREPVRRGLQRELREEAQALRESLRAEIREQLLEEMRHEVTYLVRQESQEVSRLSSSMASSLSSSSAAPTQANAAAAASEDVSQKNGLGSPRVSAAEDEAMVPVSRSLKRRWGSPDAEKDGGIRQAAEAGQTHGHTPNTNQHQKRRMASPRRTPGQGLASQQPEYSAPVVGVLPKETATGETNAEERGGVGKEEHEGGADTSADSKSARGDGIVESDTRLAAPEEGQTLQNGDYAEEEEGYEESGNGHGIDHADHALEYGDGDGENAYDDLENGQQPGFDYGDYAGSTEEGDVYANDELVGSAMEEGEEEPTTPAKAAQPEVIDLCDSDDDDDAQGQATGDDTTPAAEIAADGAAVGAAPYATVAGQHMPVPNWDFGSEPELMASLQQNEHGCLNYWVPADAHATEEGAVEMSSYIGHLDQEAPARASSSASPLPPHLAEANGLGDANSGYGGEGGSNRLLPLVHSDVSLDTDQAEPAATSVTAQNMESEYSGSEGEEEEDDEEGAEEEEEEGEEYASDEADTMADHIAPTAAGALPASEEHAEGEHAASKRRIQELMLQFDKDNTEWLPGNEHQQPAEPEECHDYEQEVAQAMEYVEQERAESVRSSGNGQPAAEEEPSYPELPKATEADSSVAESLEQPERSGSANDEVGGQAAEVQDSASPAEARMPEDVPGNEDGLQLPGELDIGVTPDDQRSEDEQRLEVGDDHVPVAEDVGDVSELQHVPSQLDMPQPEDAQMDEEKHAREPAAAESPDITEIEEAEMTIDQQAQETTVEVSYPAISGLEEEKEEVAQGTENSEMEHLEERVEEIVEVSALQEGEEAQGSIEGVEATTFEETITLEETTTVEIVAQHSSGVGEGDDTADPASLQAVPSGGQEESNIADSPERQDADAVVDDNAEIAELSEPALSDVAASATESPAMDVEPAKPEEAAFTEEEEMDGTSGRPKQESREAISDDDGGVFNDPNPVSEDGFGELASPAPSHASAVHVVDEDMAADADGEGDGEQPVEDDVEGVLPVSGEEEKEGSSGIALGEVEEVEDRDEDKHDDLEVVPAAEEGKEEEEDESSDVEEPAEGAQLSVSQSSSVFARPPGGPSNRDIAKHLGSALKPAFAAATTATNTENGSDDDEGAHPSLYRPSSRLSASTSTSPPTSAPASRRASSSAAAAAAAAAATATTTTSRRASKGKDVPPSGLQNFLYGATDDDDEGVVGGNGTADDAHSSPASSGGIMP